MKLFSPQNFAVIGVVCLGLLVRLINLNGSFWLDEAAQALESARPLSQQLDIRGDFQPPLYHLLVHFWMYAGHQEWWLRMASLMPALVSIYLTVRIGKKLYSDHVGLLAGLFLATSQFHTFYSQELRPYSLATMFGLLMMDALIDWWQSKKWAQLRFILSAVAGLYSMYVFPFLIFAALLMTFIYKPNMRRGVLLSGAAIAIGFLPWLPGFLGQLQEGTGLAASKPVWQTMVSPPLYKMLPLTALKFMIGRITIDKNLPDVALVSMVGIILLSTVPNFLNQKKRLIVTWWLMVPILLAWLVSIKVPVLDPKRVMFSLPALYLLLAAGIGTRIRSMLIVFMIVGLNLFALNEYAVNPEVQREPWREAVRRVEQNAPDNALLVFSYADHFAPWWWYQTRNLPSVSIADQSFSAENLDVIKSKAREAEQVLVFDYLMNMADSDRRIFKELAEIGLEESGFYQYPGIGKIHILTAKPAIAYDYKF